MKYWEIIADRLSKAGWSLGWVSAIDSQGRTLWIVDAHRDGKRFIVRAEEKLSAFLATRISGCWPLAVARNGQHFPINATPIAVGSAKLLQL